MEYYQYIVNVRIYLQFLLRHYVCVLWQYVEILNVWNIKFAILLFALWNGLTVMCWLLLCGYCYLCSDAIVLSENFLKYMEAFKPFFAAGLKNVEEYQVWCSVPYSMLN